MSSTPIFDATLADAPADIFLASPIFPNPVTDSFTAALIRLGHPAVKQEFGPAPHWATLAQQPVWAVPEDPRFRAKVSGVFGREEW